MAVQVDPVDDGDPRDVPDTIEYLGAAVAGEYYALEAAMIAAVAAELRRNPNDPSAIARLSRRGASMAASVDPRTTAARAVASAAQAGAGATNDALGVTSVRRFTLSGRVAIETTSLATELGDTLASLDGPLAAWMPRAYRTASAMLTLQEQSEAVASRYLAKGIPGKRYRNGAWMPIGSYAEMVTRTITHQASIVGATVTQAQAGLGLCSIVAAFDACKSCASLRGKVWSVDGTPAGTYTFPSAVGGAPVTITVAGALASASVGSHFRGPNCRCQTVPVQPGAGVVSGPGHDPKAESERDRQRELERRIRKAKAMEAAALNDDDSAAARRRVREAQKDMRAFIDDTGRNRRGYREQLEWQTGRVPAPAPVPVG